MTLTHRYPTPPHGQPPRVYQVRKAREQQSRHDMRANRQAAVQAPQQQPAPPGQFGPPRPNPWGPPRHPLPPTLGQYLPMTSDNRFAPLQQQHWEPSHNELDYPVLANNPWNKRREFKKNPPGHKNGQGKPPRPTNDRPQQPTQDKLVATRLTPTQAKKAPTPTQPQTTPVAAMAVDAAPELPTAPTTPSISAQAPQLVDMQAAIQMHESIKGNIRLQSAIGPLCQLLLIWLDTTKSMADKIRATMDCVCVIETYEAEE
ncbi:uncharacterized protein LOC134543688 [Bacillus rossius redtenbacheri]|uniref:uncharacterized protein LOC134543688 n=1 Tax=Bacillus rossius redtenbacheri TaxID=93214 RepID=UPI002FDCCF1F